MQGQYSVNKEEKETDESKLLTRNNGKCLRCREILLKFLAIQPEIRSLGYVKCNATDGSGGKTGDITFAILTSDLGFDKEIFQEYEKELFSNFMVDTFGELIVRENIGRFVQLVEGIKAREYMEMIASKEHKRFGMRIKGSALIFTFHISLIQHILTEDIRHLDW